MEGARGPIGGPHHWHLARETRRLSWALKIYSANPSIRGDAHWARPRAQRWLWLEARRKTANSLATPDRTNERTSICPVTLYGRISTKFCIAVEVVGTSDKILAIG